MTLAGWHHDHTIFCAEQGRLTPSSDRWYHNGEAAQTGMRRGHHTAAVAKDAHSTGKEFKTAIDPAMVPISKSLAH